MQDAMYALFKHFRNVCTHANQNHNDIMAYYVPLIRLAIAKRRRRKRMNKRRRRRRKTTTKKKKIISIGKDVEKLESLCTSDGSIKWCSLCGKLNTELP